MRAIPLAAAALLTLLPPCAGAYAQASKGAAKPGAAAANGARFTVLNDELMGDLPSDAIWQETRQGGKVVAAVLDVCYSPSPLSRRKDRFVVALRLENGKLVGSGQSEPDRTPITVSLVRKQTGDTFNLEGTIKRGSQIEEVGTGELSDMSEAELSEALAREEEIVAAPANFTEVVPISLGVRVANDKVADLVKALRGLNVYVDYAGLVPSCIDLRAGNQLVRLSADPERAPALVKQLKALPGVANAGWTPGAYGIERAVRIPAAPWREAGGLKKDPLAARIAAVMATALGATALPPEWDAVTRELTLKFKRPDAATPGLGLTELIEVTVLIGPEKPDGSDHLVVWIGDPSIETSDEGSGPRLTITGGDHASDEDGAAIDIEAVLAALAKEFGGQRWEPEQSAWK
jgi:hypothetical protein